MRGAVKQAISGIIPELAGHVYDVCPPDGAAEDFFAVLSLGEEIWKSTWVGYRQVVHLKLYAASSDVSKQDAWAGQLIEGLHRTRVIDANSQESCILHYLGVSEAERYDSAIGKTIRMLRFGVYVPEAAGNDDPLQPDPWLNALTVWTGEISPDPWQVSHTAWLPDRGEYAILWRLAGCETRTGGASVVEVRKSFIGHVTSPARESEHIAAITLVEELGSKLQLPLDFEQGRYLSVVDASANLQADPILDGQLKLTLMQRRSRPVEDAALIRRIHVQPILK